MNTNEEHRMIELDDLILQKEFDQLSSVEKERVMAEISSKEEYDEIRNALLAIKGVPTEAVSPSQKTKDDLMAAFSQKFGESETKVIPLYRKPAFRYSAIAAVLVVLLVGFAMVFNQFSSEQNIIKEVAHADDRAVMEEPVGEQPRNDKNENYKVIEEGVAANQDESELIAWDISPDFHTESEVYEEEEVVAGDLNNKDVISIEANAMSKSYTAGYTQIIPDVATDSIFTAYTFTDTYTPSMDTMIVTMNNQMDYLQSTEIVAATASRSTAFGLFDSKPKIIPKGRTLAQDEDMIDLLFTAK